jgi:serine/threonine protein kinase
MSEPRTLAGYELLGEVRRDGLRVIYKARHPKLARLVMVEVLQSVGDEAVVQVARLHQQVHIEAYLKHPGVVPLLEIGESDGAPYVVRQFFEGPYLDEKLAREGPAESIDAARWVEQVARTVQHLHERGIIHRALAPKAVLLADGAAVLTGFDCARHFDISPGPAGYIVGIPSSMSPEQVRGVDVGPAADVYGLGALLYHLLTGRPPFLKADVLATLRAVVEEAPVLPRAASPDVPADLEAICLKCLAKSPADRYPSALALADDLRRFLDGPPGGPPPHKRRGWFRRWWGGALCCAV